MASDTKYTDLTESVISLKHGFTLISQGAEAKIYAGTFLNKPSILKERFVKKYRHPLLDDSITSERMKAEVRALSKCRKLNIKVPAVYFVDLHSRCIILEEIANAITVKSYLEVALGQGDSNRLVNLSRKIGQSIAEMHNSSLIHGDLTTSNMMIKSDHLQNIKSDNSDFDVYFIDFGLSKRDGALEDKAVDLYVLERALSSLHPDTQFFFDAILEAYYSTEFSKKVAHKFEEVRQRGRKRSMVG